MGSLGALGIGLSVVFVGFLLLLLAELYYLLCWKKRRHHLRINSISHEAGLLANGNNNELEELEEVNVIANHHQACQTELVSKLFPDAEINHYLGPPRFLFTILEETKEELESETAARSRNGSRDFVMNHSGLFSEPGTPYETPFATPPSSPSFFLTPPGTPSASCDCLLVPRSLPREPPAAQISSCSPRHHHRYSQQHHPSSRTTMMMMLLSNASPPVTPPATPPNATSPLFYRTPPTHLSYFSPSPPLYNWSSRSSSSKGISRKH